MEKRKTTIMRQKGYDVEKDKFFYYFFNNGLLKKEIYYDTFKEYYENVPGSIYKDCCYAFYDFSNDVEFIKTNDIKLEKLTDKISFIDYTIDDWNIKPTNEELEKYKNVEKKKKKVIEWLHKFKECTTPKEFDSMFRKMNKTVVNGLIDEELVIDYLLAIDANKYQDIVIFYYLDRMFLDENSFWKLCYHYDIDILLKSFNERKYYWSKTTFYKKRTSMKEIFQKVMEEQNITYNGGYDRKSGLYYIKEYKCRKNIKTLYCDDFNKLKAYLGNDLSVMDLRYDYKLSKENIFKCKVTESTMLPLTLIENYRTEIIKQSEFGHYTAKKRYFDENDNEVKSQTFTTKFLPDFLYFVKNDLVGSDLALNSKLYYCLVDKGIQFLDPKIFDPDLERKFSRLLYLC